MDTRKPYPSDLTDAQWQRLTFLFTDRPEGLGGRPRQYAWREIVNAILYLARTGCQWRYLPHDFPPYDLVSHYYHLWRQNGRLDRLHDSLRADVRKQAGKEDAPSVVIVDSQSVPTTEKGGRRNLRKLLAMTQAKRSKAANAMRL